MRDGAAGRIGRAVGWVGLALVLAAATPSAPASAPRRITGIRAFLFNSETGGWSPDVIGNNIDLGLNVFIDYKSHSTFVIVDVDAGSDGELSDDAKVRLVAIRGSNPARGVKVAPRVLLDSTQHVGASSKKSHVGFWLPETGCYTITLTATLIAGGKSYPKRSELGFACGD